MRRLLQIALVLATIGVSAVLLGSCAMAERSTLTEASEMLQPPAQFEETEAETLNGFEAISRRLTFSTALSQNDACAAAHDALRAWADQDIPEPKQALPGNYCSFELHQPVNHREIDLAMARVSRLRTGDTYVEDPDAPGGVGTVLFVFRIDK